MSTTKPIQPAQRSRRQITPSDAACCGETPIAQPQIEEGRLVTMVDRLKALADPTRLRMLELLVAQPGELCVCDITSQFEQRQPTISHHLRILRDAGLIRGEKRGVWSYYQATEAGIQSMSTLRSFA
ncbi:MAG TPA: metalloregulator ArsR/SmtB family transcription factor [Ktedonobacterales bacterium]